jgi:uncharacterized membrane protein YhaH (DUF805 family)
VNLQQHRRHQDRTITTAVTLVCGLGLAGALSPAVEHAITTALVAVVVLALLVVSAPWAVRRLRERREDAADALAAVAWRARHMPDHPLTALDQPGRDRVGVG